jgi:hypothetical protein
MAGTESEDDENSRPTVAGCLLMVLSLAVIGGVAIPVVRWRDPGSGSPLPQEVAIAAPVVAGALCYGIGAALLKILGLPVFVRPKKEPPDASEPRAKS